MGYNDGTLVLCIDDFLCVPLESDPTRPFYGPYASMTAISSSTLKICRVIWASPYSVIGLAIGAFGLLTGGSFRFRAGAMEFYGGAVRWFVRRLPTGPYTLGITLGHVILGQDAQGLDLASLHERVHVRQFERWGPLMGPAYFLASFWVWTQGRRAYRDNPFEIEAYDFEAVHPSYPDHVRY